MIVLPTLQESLLPDGQGHQKHESVQKVEKFREEWSMRGRSRNPGS